jgi:epoxyqueuosine reductase QueG
LEWVYARWEGEKCNDGLRESLAALLKKAGEEAVAPGIDPRFGVIDKRSNWSERHAAYIAGLGTFGLGRSLITSQGCAGALAVSLLP